jgi:hypothetical protein
MTIQPLDKNNSETIVLYKKPIPTSSTNIISLTAERIISGGTTLVAGIKFFGIIPGVTLASFVISQVRGFFEDKKFAAERHNEMIDQKIENEKKTEREERERQIYESQKLLYETAVKKNEESLKIKQKSFQILKNGMLTSVLLLTVFVSNSILNNKCSNTESLECKSYKSFTIISEACTVISLIILVKKFFN